MPDKGVGRTAGVSSSPADWTSQFATSNFELLIVQLKHEIIRKADKFALDGFVRRLVWNLIKLRQVAIASTDNSLQMRNPMRRFEGSGAGSSSRSIYP